MLAACLDAAEDTEGLRKTVTKQLQTVLPHDEFSIDCQRVVRSLGSISALHVRVKSQYNHTPAPVPSNLSQEASHNHSHAHEHSYGHSHSHNHSHDLHHDHHAQNHSHHDPSTGPLRGLTDIRRLLQQSQLSAWVQEKAVAAFTALARAEAAVHGADSIDTVHFHEVGAVDSIVDTVGTLVALEALSVTSVSCSALPLGKGTVWTAHGLLPVPTPATLLLLKDRKVCPGPKTAYGELVTPTAASLFSVLCPDSDASLPKAAVLKRSGVGAGTKDFEKHPNVLRLMLLEN